MINLLTEDNINTLKNAGILSLRIPFDSDIYKRQDDRRLLVIYAMSWLRANYALNWRDIAMVVGFDVQKQHINLRLINSEMLQVVLLETQVGDEIYRQLDDLMNVAQC